MKKNYVVIFLVLTTVIFLGTGVLWVVPALLSVMMFDAPGSEQSRLTWMCVLSSMAYPPVCLVAVVCSWVLFKTSHHRSACVVALVPLLDVALFILALFLIETLQHGKFTPS